MIHIKKEKPLKGKPQFKVVKTGKNNEILNYSGKLNSKQAAWKNILADNSANHVDYSGVIVQDDTLKVPLQFLLYPDGRKLQRLNITLSPIKKSK